jgi:prevent-host-death family protein
MIKVNVHEAKTHLSRLLDRALAGEEVVIARAGRPLVRLVPVAARGRRVPPSVPGLIVTDAFLDPLPPDELARWGEVPAADETPCAS